MAGGPGLGLSAIGRETTIEQEFIDNPPGITPADMDRDMDQQPRTPSASAPSVQRPIAPQLGATPSGRISDADALDEQLVRALIDNCEHNTEDKE
eukprot:3526892-Pyramimonas_sp.AAC.1